MDISLLMGYIAGFFTTFAFLPQAIKTIRTQDTRGISLSMYCMFVTGVALWALYGFFTQNYPILIWNIIVFLFSSPILWITARQYFKRKTR